MYFPRSRPNLIERKTNTYTESTGSTAAEDLPSPDANAFIDTSGLSSVESKAAFFDVDGTVCKTNVVLAYFSARVEELAVWVRLVWVPYFILTCVLYLIVDWFHRPTFNRIFYMSYRGRTVESKAALAKIIYTKYYKPRIFKDAAAIIKRLKAEGFKIVLVTGSLDFLVAPLAEDLDADHVYAAEIIEENGRLTGKLKGMYASNDEKALRVQDFAREHGMSLSNCLGFGDSIADLPMLEIVGRAYVVNPDARLRAIALRRGWPVMQWMLAPAKL
ncbi:hypothetical protein SELMODRAFT_404662 [Selaginella moellendorffii]|uniref:HAD-IB family hydrolase n=2 Tax=Selaginella moellendorffii TaxID=88036 RepID=D8QW08_SELML|nr:uncharacterized protein LOC9643298 [Selaginella moellendorffii]XP_002980408.1 uncharacterized protein LOC9648031 isoform X2 [Selaginella moellendorffii]EFJ18668.1 hypothetical protein SELMODRAFT_444476 [Selaginella moellendorffii]EFJ36150.1 hypothetical protein SELMODRAFT_404662 [Selaginella moellendorffii]|eukprot:XP_002962687.1 uncharacterized protein LOC9643298 [Selaginella moellendorffii]